MQSKECSMRCWSNETANYYLAAIRATFVSWILLYDTFMYLGALSIPPICACPKTYGSRPGAASKY